MKINKIKALCKAEKQCVIYESRARRMLGTLNEDADLLKRAKELGLTKKQIEAIKGRMGARKRKMGELEEGCSD